ncbi:hypothetical protein [Guptibacillus spartinae]|uniref:hypothetical protein n=1 Tax=Guptibacillus spartinae TaxID=3025679 RepID=UPI00235EE63C|nr:hypothetical protein [Pseudalkalibacillus spartinae]
MKKTIITLVLSMALAIGGYVGYESFFNHNETTNIAVVEDTEAKAQTDEQPHTELEQETVKEKSAKTTEPENKDPKPKEEVNQSNQTSTKPESVPPLDQQEVQEILKSNLTAIRTVLMNKGEENGWGVNNPGKYSVIKPAVAPYVTEHFSTETLQKLSEVYYCECDFPYLPSVIDDVKFSYKQNGNSLQIQALSPGDNLNTMGSMWKFTIVNADNSWKMEHWEEQSLEGKDIQLNKEEAAQLLAYGTEAPIYVDEFYSDQAKGKAYLFDMSTAESEYFVGVSSKDTQLVYDYPKQESSSEDLNRSTASQTIYIEDFYLEYFQALHFDYTREQLLEEFGPPLTEIQESNGRRLEYPDAIYYISKNSQVVYAVKIHEEQASRYYATFDEVIAGFNPDPVYAKFENSNNFTDEDGYVLTMDSYEEHLYFTSNNENGNPINSIFVTIDYLK